MKILGIVVLFFGLSTSSAQAQEAKPGWICKCPVYGDAQASATDPVETENQTYSDYNDDSNNSIGVEKQFSTPQGGQAPVAGEAAPAVNNTFEKACDQDWSVPQVIPVWTVPNPPGELPFQKY